MKFALMGEHIQKWMALNADVMLPLRGLAKLCLRDLGMRILSRSSHLPQEFSLNDLESRKRLLYPRVPETESLIPRDYQAIR